MTTASRPTGDAYAAHALKIIESMSAFAWSADARGRFTYISPNTLAYFGTAPSELDPLPGQDECGWRRVVHPADYERVAASWRHCLATGDEYETEHRMRRADGVYRWFRSSGRAARDDRGRITQWYGTTIDVEEQKKVEAQLRERERELSQFVDMIPSHVWRLTREGEPTFFNKRMVDFLGLDVTDLDRPGISRLAVLIETVHPDDAAAFGEALSRCLATGERFSMSYRLRRADGVYHWMSSRAEALRDHDGRILQWYGLCHDIEEQVKAAEALRRSELQWQQMFEALPVQIWCATPAGRFSFMNRRFQKYLGLSEEELKALTEMTESETIPMRVHPDDVSDVVRTLSDCFRTGDAYAARYRLLGADGAYRWTEGRAEALRDESGAIVQWYGVSLDVDDEMRAQFGRIRAQEELRLAHESLARASQAASLAELSASIAHEVNQPLAAVVTNSHACLRWLSVEPPNLERAQTTAERIIRDANAAAEVLSRIRALFKQTVRVRSRSTIGSLIAEVRQLMTEVAWQNAATIETDLEPDLPMLAFDGVQIQQVLVNLVRNALEAMDGMPAPRTLRVRACKEAGAVRVEVSDRGRGIEHPDRIFDPFFSTKEGGMGMGLAICRSIVEAHDGRLWAESNERGGSTFIFTMPIERPDRSRPP